MYFLYLANEKQLSGGWAYPGYPNFEIASTISIVVPRTRRRFHLRDKFVCVVCSRLSESRVSAGQHHRKITQLSRCIAEVTRSEILSGGRGRGRDRTLRAFPKESPREAVLHGRTMRVRILANAQRNTRTNPIGLHKETSSPERSHEMSRVLLFANLRIIAGPCLVAAKLACDWL